MSAQPASCTVYFDGDCPLCRREIAHYRGQPGATSIAWVDAANCDVADLGDDLPREAALARLHVRRADGTLVAGAAAFAAVWSRLPAYRWLAGIAGGRLGLAMMDAAYAGFLQLRPLWRRLKPPAGAPSPSRSPDGRAGAATFERAATAALPADVLADLRTDHAGELGAVQIYRGVLAVARDGELRAFAARHLAAEHLHLRRLRRWLPAGARSRLLPLWRLAGWLTGAAPALFGPRAVFVTVAAVEGFVDRHYAAQIERLQAHPELAELRATLAACRSDEIDHRNDALARLHERPGRLARGWAAIVGRGSDLAVAASRRL
jgi:ubiquinone biosynthesis monooxygenase Coq7